MITTPQSIGDYHTGMGVACRGCGCVVSINMDSMNVHSETCVHLQKENARRLATYTSSDLPKSNN